LCCGFGGIEFVWEKIVWDEESCEQSQSSYDLQTQRTSKYKRITNSAPPTASLGHHRLLSPLGSLLRRPLRWRLDGHCSLLPTWALLPTEWED
jgi:hypothetical protein